MGVKIGETPILRGSPPILRTLEVRVDEDWLLTEELTKCVSFQESQIHSGKVVVVFSRSISAAEARAFASLLLAAARVIEEVETETETAEKPESG